MLNKLTVTLNSGYKYILDLSLANNKYGFNKEKVVSGCINKAVIFANKEYKDIIKMALKIIFTDAINEVLYKCKTPLYPNLWWAGLSMIEYELKNKDTINRYTVAMKQKINLTYPCISPADNNFWINSGISDYNFEDGKQIEWWFSYLGVKAPYMGKFKESIKIYDNFSIGLNHKTTHIKFKELIDDNEQQTLIFTDDVTLLSNDYLRPDCYFKTFDTTDNSKNYPLHVLTDRELKSAHNIEKMFRAGEFNL